MLVPKGKLRLALLKECHDGPVAGHRGVKPTLAELVKNYYWPNLRDDVEQYVKLCVTCQQNRTQFRKKAGLLRPLPIPTKCWESISMDFMTHLPESKGFNSIMVVVDRVSKMAHFVPTGDTATAQEVGRLYFDKVVKHHGMQKNIISDRDPKFMSRFWRALWKKLGTELKMSTAFRPQTEGQTERVNLVLQEYLRNYVNADQTDWADHISMAEFNYNNTKHSGMGFSPFMVPELVGNHEEYEVETILNKRKLRSRDTEYLVKWRGYHVKEAT